MSKALRAELHARRAAHTELQERLDREARLPVCAVSHAYARRLLALPNPPGEALEYIAELREALTDPACLIHRILDLIFQEWPEAGDILSHRLKG